MTDTVNVQVIFEKTAPDGTVYRDALYFPVADYEKMKQADIDAAKQQRFDNWQKAIKDAQAQAVIDANTPAPVPQAADIVDQLNTLKQAVSDITDSVTALTSQGA